LFFDTEFTNELGRLGATREESVSAEIDRSSGEIGRREDATESTARLYQLDTWRVGRRANRATGEFPRGRQSADAATDDDD
jgi:hypothetical protein